jgi:hypothetical protein
MHSRTGEQHDKDGIQVDQNGLAVYAVDRRVQANRPFFH